MLKTVGSVVLFLLVQGCARRPRTDAGPPVPIDAPPLDAPVPEGGGDAGAALPRFGDCLERSDALVLLLLGSCEVQCRFDDCTTEGWTTTYAAGLRGDTTCSFGDCAHEGWRTTWSDGVTTSVSCRFGDCNADGWRIDSSVSGADGSVDCSFEDCLTEGYRFSFDDGTSGTVDCSFEDCAADGFRISGSGSASCTCSFGDCNEGGARCD